MPATKNVNDKTNSPSPTNRAVVNLFQKYIRTHHSLKIQVNGHRVNSPTLDLMGITNGDIDCNFIVIETLWHYHDKI